MSTPFFFTKNTKTNKHCNTYNPAKIRKKAYALLT